jgi:hypothetical protein
MYTVRKGKKYDPLLLSEKLALGRHTQQATFKKVVTNCAYNFTIRVWHVLSAAYSDREPEFTAAIR